MQTIPLQKAIEQAKANPNSDFATKLRQAIESGKLDQAAQKQGVDLTKFGRPAPQTTERKPFLSETVGGINPFGLNTSRPERALESMQDIKETGQGIKTDINKRLDTVNEIQNSDISGIRKATQVFGQGLGAFQDVLGQGFKGLAKVILNPEQEQQIKEGVSKTVGSVVETKPAQFLINEYQKLEETNPELARDVDTALNTIMTALDVAGPGSASAVKSAATKGIKESAEQVGKTAIKTAKAQARFAGDVAGSVIGKSDRYVNSAVTKALDLTQGDVKNIALSTSNQPGEWLAKNNLIRGNVDETVSAFKEFGDGAYNKVRQEIGKVTNNYPVSDLPRYKQALEAVAKQVGGVPGLESVSNEALSLLGKETATLIDVQRAKELMDDVFNLYKATGDVKEQASKEGLANMRKELKEFIEQEVLKTTGTDISKLNNDVATARSLEDAVKARSTRGLTRSNIGLGDLGAFSAGSFAGGPIGGVLAVITKKLLQSPPVALKFAKWLDKLSDTRKAKLKAEFEAGNIPPEVEKILDVKSPVTK